MERLANPTPTEFESALLDALLDGDHPYLASLRLQRDRSTPVLREWSTAGEFLTFRVHPDAPLVSPGNFELGDVHFHMRGIEHPFGGAVVFIRKGTIEFLETYSYVDDFPAPGAERDFRLWYGEPEHRIEQLEAELNWRLRGMPKDDSIPRHFEALRRQLGL
jgi:hypothetical protein